MDDNFMELSKDEIELIENALEINPDYKLKNVKFNTKTFEKGQEIIIIQYIADIENELMFNTKEENGKYYIAKVFELFIDNILNGNVSRDIFQSVSDYFWEVIENPDKDFENDKRELINFLILADNYEKELLNRQLDPVTIRLDYENDYKIIYANDSLNRVEKSLALKELVHMSICQVVDELDLFFTRPLNLTPEEIAEKNKQERIGYENELQLS